MPQRKKNNLNNLRQTREGFRPARSSEPVESEMEKGWPPAWSVSFADMMTLLMCFFILWYALTVMRFPPELLRMKVRKEFYVDITDTKEMLETYEVLVEHGMITREVTEEFKDVVTETHQYKEALEELKKFLKEQDLLDKVHVEIKGKEFVISPQSDLLFDKGKAVIKPENHSLLKEVAFILKAAGALARIEGYTDDTPILPYPYHRQRYPTNWELSAARAVSVARHLIDDEEIRPENISVCGYGPLRPLAPNTTSENKAKNRRVEIHMMLSARNSNNNFDAGEK